MFYDEEANTEIYLREYRNGQAYGAALELISYNDYIEDLAVKVQKEYKFSDGVSYELQSSDGERLMIVYKDKIVYPDGAEYEQ